MHRLIKRLPGAKRSACLEREMIVVKVSGTSSAYQLGKHFPLLTPSVLIAFLKHGRTEMQGELDSKLTTLSRM